MEQEEIGVKRTNGLNEDLHAMKLKLIKNICITLFIKAIRLPKVLSHHFFEILHMPIAVLHAAL